VKEEIVEPEPGSRPRGTGVDESPAGPAAQSPSEDAPEADPLVGWQVRKEFCTGWFMGEVRRMREVEHGGRQVAVWQVVYSDGDREEMDLEELHPVLIPPEAGRAREAEAGSTKAAVGTLVEKRFGEDTFKGIVTSSRRVGRHVWWYIAYEDGDQEEIGISELCTLMVAPPRV